MDNLTITENQRLTQLEDVVSVNLRAFYEVGSALLEIRESRLYRNTHETFEDYCKERWDMTRMYAHYLIESKAVIDNLQNVNNCLQIPVNESQARPLTRLAAPLQIEAWKKAVETAPEGKITARHINHVVSEIEGKEERKRHIRERKYEATEAMHFAGIALANLECIRSDDPKRQKAFDYIVNWIEKNRQK